VDAKEHAHPLMLPDPVFGRSSQARPGEVPWGAAPALLALAIAIIGVVLLVFALGTLGSGSTASAEGATVPGALSALLSTVIVDSWFVGVAWWHSLRRFALSATSWGFRRLERRSLPLVLVGLALSYVALIVSTSVYARLFGPPPEQNIIKDFPHTGPGMALFAVTAIIVAPIFEETFFRGFLFQGLARSWGPVAGALVSAGLFTLAHQQVSVFVPFFILGLILAWVFYRSRSLWANIAVHASFNCVSVLVWVALGTLPPFRLLIL
jgi:membrane protease YdiL (CAAX protease family)